jgi:hypothetical protein
MRPRDVHPLAPEAVEDEEATQGGIVDPVVAAAATVGRRLRAAPRRFPRAAGRCTTRARRLDRPPPHGGRLGQHPCAVGRGRRGGCGRAGAPRRLAAGRRRGRRGGDRGHRAGTGRRRGAVPRRRLRAPASRAIRSGSIVRASPITEGPSRCACGEAMGHHPPGMMRHRVEVAPGPSAVHVAGPQKRQLAKMRAAYPTRPPMKAIGRKLCSSGSSRRRTLVIVPPATNAIDP